MTIYNRIISTSSGLGMLQMVLEPTIGWCAREDVGLQRGGGVDCEILHPLEW